MKGTIDMSRGTEAFQNQLLCTPSVTDAPSLTAYIKTVQPCQGSGLQVNN